MIRTLSFARLKMTAFAAAIVAAAATLSASVTAPKVVPVSASQVIAVPSTSKLKEQWGQNPLSAVTKEILSVAGVAKKLSEATEFLPEIEKELGFPISAETLSSMFSGFDLFMGTPADKEVPFVGMVARVDDKEKLNRFLGYWEKAAAKAAAETMQSEGGSSETQTREIITTVTLEGEVVKKIELKGATDFYYVVLQSHLLVASDKDIMTGMVARATGKKSAGSFAEATDYDKVSAFMANKPAVIYVYQNSQAALASLSKSEDMRKLSKLVQDLTPFAMSATAVVMDSKSIRATYYAPFATGSENSPMRKLFERASTASSTSVLNVAPERTLLTWGTNMFDAFLIYDVIRDFVAAAGSGKAADLDSQLKELEPLIGFSVKNDLLPAFGREMGFFLNSLDLSAGLPVVDAALVIEIRDKDRMQKVLAAVERQVSEQLKQTMTPPSDKDAAAAPQVSFKSVREGDVTIKYLDLPPLPTLTPGYAVAGNYLIIATSKETVQKLLAVKDGKEKGLLHSAAIKEMPGIEPKGVGFSYVNFNAIWDVVAGIPQIASTPEAESVLKALRAIKSGAGYAQVVKDAVVSESVLVMTSTD